MRKWREKCMQCRPKTWIARCSIGLSVAKYHLCFRLCFHKGNFIQMTVCKSKRKCSPIWNKWQVVGNEVQCNASLHCTVVIRTSFLSWQALFYNESLAAVIDRVQIAAILFVFCFTEPTLAQDRRLIMQRTEHQWTALQCTASSMQIGSAVHCSFTVHWCGATYQQNVSKVHSAHYPECSVQHAECRSCTLCRVESAVQRRRCVLTTLRNCF